MQRITIWEDVNASSFGLFLCLGIKMFKGDEKTILKWKGKIYAEFLTFASRNFSCIAGEKHYTAFIHLSPKHNKR